MPAPGVHSVEVVGGGRVVGGGGLVEYPSYSTTEQAAQH